MGGVLRRAAGGADATGVECELCGGTGHGPDGCSMRPTAIMDFLRDFRSDDDRWLPAAEKRLAPSQLGAAPAGATMIPSLVAPTESPAPPPGRPAGFGPPRRPTGQDPAAPAAPVIPLGGAPAPVRPGAPVFPWRSGGTPGADPEAVPPPDYPTPAAPADDTIPASAYAPLAADHAAPQAAHMVPPADDAVPPAEYVVPPADYVVPPADYVVPPADYVVPPIDYAPPPTADLPVFPSADLPAPPAPRPSPPARPAPPSHPAAGPGLLPPPPGPISTTGPDWSPPPPGQEPFPLAPPGPVAPSFEDQFRGVTAPAGPPVGQWPQPAPAAGTWPPGPPVWTRSPSSVGGRRRAVKVGAALAAAVVVVAGGLGAVALRSRGPSYPSAWDPRVAPIAAFVEGARGLHWKHPVRVEFLPPAQFVRTINAGDGGSGPAGQQQQYLALSRALGLIWGSVDLGAAGKALTDNEVVGLYVPKDKTVYVRGSTLTPFVRVTLAHELTHALQDEYFPLSKLKGGPTDDESATAALIEGDAVRIEDDYARTLSAADQQSYADAEQSGSSAASKANSAQSVPAFLADSAEFPYDFGPTFVQSLLRQGGNALVDSAFRHPPSLDGQVIDPTTFQPGAPVPKVALPAPPEGAKVVQPAGGFGEVPLVEALGYEVGYDRAWSAMQGWTADRFDGYQVDGRVCADVAVLTDSGADAGRLAATARRWAAALPGAGVTATGATVVLHSCDPGANWRPRSTVDPYPQLAARSFWIGEFEQEGKLSAGTSTCIVDDLTGQLGSRTLVAAARAASVTDPAVAAILTHERQDVADCL